MVRNRLDIALAIIAPVVFFLPVIMSGGKDAGPMYTGDMFMLWVPHLLPNGFYFQHAITGAIDFMTHGGSSEFFLRANIPAFHPLTVLGTLLLPVRDVHSAILLVLAIQLVHCALGVWFSLKLARRLGFDTAFAVFVAIGFVFSLQMARAVPFHPFSMTVWLLPGLIEAGLRCAERFSARNVTLAAGLTLLAFLSGYPPLAMAVVVAAIVFAAAWIGWVQPTGPGGARAIARKMLNFLAPTALATLAAAPLYIAIASYHASEKITRWERGTQLDPLTWLQRSAHNFAEEPFAILRALSDSIVVSTPYFEFSLHFGLIGVMLFVLFVAGWKGRLEGPAHFGRLLGVAAVMFLFVAMLSYGRDWVGADIFYFSMPGIGSMHIYQRHLVWAQLFLVIALAIMLYTVIHGRESVSLKRAGALWIVLALVTAFLVATNRANYGGVSLSPHLVFEMLVAALAALALLFFRSPAAAAIAVTLLVVFVPMERFYNLATAEGNRAAAQSARRVVLDRKHLQPVAGKPEPEIVDRSTMIKEYLLSRSDKEIVKYVDIAAGIDSYVPKNYPWYVMFRGEDRWISTFYGYELHVSTPSAYRELNPPMVLPGSSDWTYRINWPYALRAGAEFVLYKEGDADLDPAMQQHVDLSDPARVLRFEDKGLVLAPLKQPERPDLAFDNGYLIVEGPARVTEFDTNRANKIAIGFEADGETRITYPFWGHNETLHFLLDGREVEPEFVDNLATFTVPAGTHRFEMRYRNGLLRLFTFTYVLFIAGCLAAAIRPQFSERRIGPHLARWRERIVGWLPE